VPAGYYLHAVQRMNQRGISRAQVEDTVTNPTSVVDQPNGNRLYTGRGGIVVVTDPEGWVVTVFTLDE
jgi:hypothetical protein